MKKELVIKKCLKCGALVKVFKDCECDDCGIKCCGEQMKSLNPNSVDAAVEKHLPVYEIKGDKIIIKVNHVMEEEHYIEWITLVTDNGEYTKYFKPGDSPIAEFSKEGALTAYAYCNKHGLWSKDID